MHEYKDREAKVEWSDLYFISSPFLFLGGEQNGHDKLQKMEVKLRPLNIALSVLVIMHQSKNYLLASINFWILLGVMLEDGAKLALLTIKIGMSMLFGKGCSFQWHQGYPNTSRIHISPRKRCTYMISGFKQRSQPLLASNFCLRVQHKKLFHISHKLRKFHSS